MSKEIYYLSDYNWEHGVLVSEGKKNFKIYTPGNDFYPSRTFYVSKDKCAFPDDVVCVVWQSFKGKNGRGSYYVEHELYPEHRIPAKQIARQSIGPGRVTIRTN